MCFLLYGSEILSKNSAKLRFFFSKKIEIFEIQNFKTNSIIYCFFIILLAFLVFCFLFHLSKLVQKLWNFLWCFIGRVRDFTNDFWKILKVLLKKYKYVKYFFFQNSADYYLFFLGFCYFLHFIFNFLYLYLWKSSGYFYVFFILWIRDFIKEFWKITENFSKKYRHLISKILTKFHRLLFVFFYSFSILVIFSSYFTYPNLSKNSKHFCGALLYGLYILSENFGKFLNFY